MWRFGSFCLFFLLIFSIGFLVGPTKPPKAPREWIRPRNDWRLKLKKAQEERKKAKGELRAFMQQKRFCLFVCLFVCFVNAIYIYMLPSHVPPFFKCGGWMIVLVTTMLKESFLFFHCNRFPWFFQGTFFLFYLL